VRVRVGEWRRYVTLQAPSGSAGTGYEDRGQVWASVKFIGGQAEALASGAPTALARWLIQLKYRDDVRAEWRVREPLTNRTWQISGYGDTDGRRMVMDLVCAEIQ
jgi:SPP1 family predicted phage head-tail adaptor